MQIVRKLLWVLLALVILAFMYFNWGERHDVIIWPSDNNRSLLFEWPVGFIALVFFLLGAVPTWLFHRGVRWQMNRRIKSLENAIKANSLSTSQPAATETPAEQPKSDLTSL